ncbi:hypothetical protein N865_13385 [Intrasporangium oryzae NRRL B-24470]|uniref:Uncharacterized protein n=1 Tax=Intrasporangium oryzae NRRL B-24470 TaxID=1386089 RepID=W9G677_9MICO|nr:hypothetical protein [Intrasporangium oryzae]EWT00822.1 hypothetical protein N865_13385 [Intrasporangium oryzae NRRL B-24470]
MPVVRVYVPLGRPDLEELGTAGALPAGPGTPRVAYAVTRGLEASAPGLDVEDLEYAAFSDAVAAAGALRSAPGDRRVVAAADADASWVAPRDGRTVSMVALTVPLPLARVASFHIDDAVSAGAVDDEADELLWYDVTELDDVRAFFG